MRSSVATFGAALGLLGLSHLSAAGLVNYQTHGLCKQAPDVLDSMIIVAIRGPEEDFGKGLDFIKFSESIEFTA